MSILLTLKNVCQALSKAEGVEGTLAPYQLFDIIGGVGTGGWLAILLGRYKLTIDDCMSIYIGIAKAIDPTSKRIPSSRARNLPAVLDVQRLVDKIEKIIDDHGISPFMLDEAEADVGAEYPSCHAFAVGVIKRGKSDTTQQYHLFRAYPTGERTNHAGPDPTKCRVSQACAATAAAKDFSKEYNIGSMTYWDDTFPHTHNVSELALDEAAALFDANDLTKTAPAFVLSISPGIPTDDEIGCLQKCARKNASVTHRAKTTAMFHLRRVNSDRIMVNRGNAEPQDQKSKSCPTLPGHEFNVRRTDTSSSMSSFKTERKHQQAIKTRLGRDFGDRDLYHRLELEQDDSIRKPYLNDITEPDKAMDLTTRYLMLSTTQSVIESLVARSRGPSNSRSISYTSQRRSETPQPMTTPDLPDTISSQDHALLIDVRDYYGVGAR